TAQLIDSETGGHIWAERFDRDLADIFALQDEISQAIVGALKVRLLPQEKKALGRRGTNNAEAYELFLLARQYTAKQSQRYLEIAMNLLKKAIELDPNFGDAWARLAGAQSGMRGFRIDAGDPQESLRRALEIDPDLPLARAVKARFLANVGDIENATREADFARRMDPDSTEVAMRAAGIYLQTRRYKDAIAAY